MNKIKKTVTRNSLIILNGFRSIFSPLLSIIFSYIIVNYFSKALWGNFVEYVLFFLITNVICEWGNRSFLLRTFSENPKEMISNWQNLFLARTPIFFLTTISIVILFSWQLIPFLILWLLGIFIYNSILSITYYYRDYFISVIIEAFGFIIIISQLIIYQENLNLTILIRSYSIGIIFKMILSIIYYSKFFYFKSLKIKFKILKTSFPFFILGLTGFLHSKIDVYTYSLFHKGQPLGEYQIISGFFVFASSFISLLLFPFIKNFYRLKSNSILKLKKIIIRYGIFINLVIILIIHNVLRLGFQIYLSPIQISIGYLISFPPYVYTTHIYHLLKIKKENIVVKISLYSFLLNLVISLTLLYLDYNITGILLASAIAQFFCMIYALKFKIHEY
ncbi:hypothetical protein [uncultured Tenacibaculum sp.]|uniref:hypothetical protein n=1 Tax=uncultured Tenacibaculum sp. TaxID=174713 RepID=UPI00262C9CC6|nr:hypothetical protein [uncultured Tenacibaculum sp.]